MRRICTLFIALCIVIGMSAAARATVISGPINNLPEGTGVFTWGSGFKQQWSVFNINSSGWFYGSDWLFISNVDVYTYAGLTDPTTVTDASVFAYSKNVTSAQEGDTVFFRGVGGGYGAWVIHDISPTPGGPTLAQLNGTWYYQNDQTANFSSSVPEPSTMLLLGSGLVGLGLLRRRLRG